MAFAQYQFRRDTAANWTSANPVLLAGELGYETNTQQFKVGNGTTAWNSLPYGGIQGPQGVQGPQGAAGTNGWSPIIANVADGERRVLRLVDWTGGTGTKPAVPTDNYIGPTGFTNLAGATDIRGATGATGATGPAANAFTNIAVSGQNTVVADQANDTLTLVGSGSVTVTTDAATDTVTIAGAVAAPQNCFANVSVGTTPTPTVLQSDLAADTLTVNAGAGISLTADAATDTFTIANTLPGYTTTTLNAPTASFSTAVTTILSQAITGGSIVAGSAFRFRVRAQVINTTAASNLVATVSIGATNVVVLTQAMGTTARAAPGGAVIIDGTISFSSGTAAEASVRAFTGTAVAFDAAAATTAAVTVVTATNTTADIKLNSSAATTTVIVREAMLERIK